MPTTTNPADLLTPQELASFLQLPDGPAALVDIAQPLITAASLLCEEATHRPLKARTVTSLRLAGRSGPKLYVDLFPIDTSQTVSVAVDGQAQTVWRTEADGSPDGFDVLVGSDDQLNGNVGLNNHLWRWLSWDIGLRSQQWFPEYFYQRQHPYVLLLSWTGGFATVPEDLKLACKFIAQQIYRDQTKQETATTSRSSRVGGAAAFTVADIPLKAAAILTHYQAPVFPMAAA